MKHEKVSQPSTFWIVEFGNQSFRSSVVCGRKHVNKYLDRLTPNLVKTVCLNLNLNSLLVKRQTDNTSPGGALGGKLVPGSHKSCEFGHTIIISAEENSDSGRLFQFLIVWGKKLYL